MVRCGVCDRSIKFIETRLRCDHCEKPSCTDCWDEAEDKIGGIVTTWECPCCGEPTTNM